MTYSSKIQQSVQERVNDSLEQFISINHGNSRFEVLPDEEDLPHVVSARYDDERDVFIIRFTTDAHKVMEVNDMIKVFLSLDEKSITGFEFSQVKQSRRGFAPTLIQRLRDIISPDRNNVSEAIRENIKINLAQDVLRGKLDEELQLAL